MSDEEAAPLPNYRRIVDASASVFATAVLIYIGFKFLPQEIRCFGGSAVAARCVADPVQVFPSSEPFQLILEVQMMLALGALGAAGGYIERALDRRTTAEAGSAFSVMKYTYLAARLIQISTASIVGILAGIVIPTLLIETPTPYAEVDMDSLAVLAFAAGFGASRLVPDLIYQFQPQPTERTGVTGKDLVLLSERSEESTFAIREIAARLEMIFDQPTLDNWCGRVGVRPKAGEWISVGGEERIEIPEGKAMPLQILFEPMACSNGPAAVISEKIDISGGNATAESVLFGVALDGRGFDPTTPSARGTVEASQSGPAQIVLDPGPLMAGPYDIIVEITQKGRLIQTLIVPILVPAQPAEA